jgi:predicted DsbA family dithiol-disulfide isomerase
MIQKNGETIARGAQTRLQRLGQVYGINFTFNGKVGNSRTSHRLTHYAGMQGPAMQRKVIEMIFERHFERTGDINDENFLLEIARDAGLNEAEVLQYLGSDTVAAEVDSIAEDARRSGVNHVPTVELNGMRIEGADEPGEFYEALMKVRELV